LGFFLCAASERTATIRSHRPASLGSDSESAANWLYADRDQATFLRVSRWDTPSVRWQKLKKQKIVELDTMLEHIQTMRDLLEQQGKCRCAALEECGKKIFEKQCEKGLS
jgi:hypothetical protein